MAAGGGGGGGGAWGEARSAEYEGLGFFLHRTSCPPQADPAEFRQRVEGPSASFLTGPERLAREITFRASSLSVLPV